MYLFQGRTDFVFDISQATRAFARLDGPKRLYVGNFGHSPSTFPGPDIGFVLSEGRAFFDTHLKGVDSGGVASRCPGDDRRPRPASERP